MDKKRAQALVPGGSRRSPQAARTGAGQGRRVHGESGLLFLLWENCEQERLRARDPE